MMRIGGAGGGVESYLFDTGIIKTYVSISNAPVKLIISICYIFVSEYLKRSDEVAPPAPPTGEACHVQ